MKKKHSYYLLLLPMMVAACSGEANEIPVRQETGVSVEKVSLYNGEHMVSYSGVVEAKEVTPLSFSSMGTVTTVYVEEGQEVKKGQLLARINSATAENMHQLALQKLEQAQDAHNRLKPMKDNGTLPEIKWVEVEVGLNQARSAVAIAKKGITDCYLYAPANGIIGKKYILPGVNVLPGTPVFDLVDIRSVLVKVPVPENEISSFKRGEESVVSITAISRQVKGIVHDIGVSADMLSHTYPLRIEVKNTDKLIRPGMICSVSVVHKEVGKGVLLSGKCLMQDSEGNQFVYVYSGNKVFKRNVKTIAFMDQKVVVSGELEPNDEIVVSGQQKLHSGALVTVIR